MIVLIFLILSIIILIIFSIIDFKFNRIENRYILAFGIFTIFIRLVYFKDFSFSVLFSFLFMGILGYTLWRYKAIGGADAKLLSILSFILPFNNNSFANMFVVLYDFMWIFLIVGIVYAFVYSRFTKVKRIPFIPCITICFILLWISRIY